VFLVGTGRAADVYDLGDGRVLRRYRGTGGDTAREARAMAHAARFGFPVPLVHDHDGPDLVMDRVDGPSMLADIGRRPWLLARHARLLADLHVRLAAVPAFDGLDAPLGYGDRLVHGDLHPDNVLLTADGPVVIDWSNTCRGPAGGDAAYTYVILTTSDVEKLVEKLGQQTFAALFRRACPPFDDLVPAAVRLRLLDRNLRPSEAARLRRMGGPG
jgi:aminoglycoside phosphotransferase (APT) family kinase protein